MWDFGLRTAGWGWHKTKGWISDEVHDRIADVLTMMTAWVLDALATVITMMLRESRLWRFGETETVSRVVRSSDGSLYQTAWFTTAIRSMETMGLWTAAIALVVGITTAAWSMNGALILRRLTTQIIKWFFLTFFLVSFTTTAMEIFDGMEIFFVQSALGESTGQLFGNLTSLNEAASESGALSSLVVTLVSMLLVSMGLVVMFVLFIRDAALALVLLFAPLVSGLLMTPYSKAIASYLNKVAALVMLKFILIASITLGAAAMVNVAGVGGNDPGVLVDGSGEPPSSLTGEEAEFQRLVVADAEQQAVTVMLRDMMAGVAVLGLALFTPGFISGILPIGGNDPHADKGQAVAVSAGGAARRGLRQRVRRR